MLGVAGTIQYLSSGSGHLQLMTTPQVRQLETQVKQGTEQIEQLTKKLEAAADAMEKPAAKFSALEHRVEALHPSSESSPTKPLAEEPPSAAPTQPTAPPSPSPS